MSRTVKRKKFLTTFKNEIRNNIEDINDYIYGYKSLEKSLSHLSDWNKLEFLNDINYLNEVIKTKNKKEVVKKYKKFVYKRYSYIHSEYHHNTKNGLGKFYKKNYNKQTRVKQRNVLKKVENNYHDYDYIDDVTFVECNRLKYSNMYYSSYRIFY